MKSYTRALCSGTEHLPLFKNLQSSKVAFQYTKRRRYKAKGSYVWASWRVSSQGPPRHAGRRGLHTAARSSPSPLSSACHTLCLAAPGLGSFSGRRRLYISFKLYQQLHLSFALEWLLFQSHCFVGLCSITIGAVSHNLCVTNFSLPELYYIDFNLKFCVRGKHSRHNKNSFISTSEEWVLLQNF